MSLITLFVGIVSFGHLTCPSNPLKPQFELFGARFIGDDKNVDYLTATEFCRERNGQLASLRTFEQQSNIKELILNSTNFGTDDANSIWVGAVDVGGAKSSGSEGANRFRFVYDDGSTEGIDDFLHVEESWAVNSPDDINAAENCVVLTGVGAQFLFEDVQCSKVQRGLVCEYSCNTASSILPKSRAEGALFDTAAIATRQCSSGTGNEFALLRHDSGASFSEAESACVALGGHLASFDSQAQYLSLLAQTNITIPVNGATWVGVYDPLGAELPNILNNINSSRFSFVDGSTAGLEFLRSDNGSLPWSNQNNLNDVDGLRNCALMSGLNGNDLLVTPCNAVLSKSWCRFRCEEDLPEVSFNVSDGFFDSVELASFQCQNTNDKVEFRVINTDTAENFDTAELNCRKMGGHLASITNKDDMQKLGDVVIDSFFSGNQLAWIGLFNPRFAAQNDIFDPSFQENPFNYNFIDGNTNASFVHTRVANNISASFPWADFSPGSSGITSLSCVGISNQGLLKTRACETEFDRKICKFDCTVPGNIVDNDGDDDGNNVVYVTLQAVVGTIALLGFAAILALIVFARRTKNDLDKAVRIHMFQTKPSLPTLQMAVTNYSEESYGPLSVIHNESI